MLRRAITLALALVAVPALSQDTKAPKIEPTTFKDPGKVAYKFVKGQSDSYVTETTTKTVIAVEVAGQNINITTDGSGRARVVYTPLDDAVPTKMEVVTDHIKMKQNIDNPMMPVVVTIDDKKIKATSNGQVVYDSETGETNPMAEQFIQGVKHLGKKATVAVDADGRAGGAVEGDPAAVKQLKELIGQGLYPILWKGQAGLNVGDTWEVVTELKTMQEIALKTPVKITNTYKVVGAVLLDGVPCIEISTRSVGKASNLDCTMEQGGMAFQLKIESLAMDLSGRALFDPAKGRPVYSDNKGTVEFAASGDVPQAGGQMAIKANMSVKATQRLNAPW